CLKKCAATEMAGKNDEFLRDLSFSGIPSEYRQFRRKILLSVASLESKQIRLALAGPKILTRLSGEAWRATEHLSVGELRSENGWSKVLAALDSHYRFLPETELNESVDEFLFGLKRRPNEGPTAFISRFKAALSRLETLIAADKAAQKSDSKRRRRKPKAAATVPSTSSSESDISSMEAAGMTAENVQRASASAAAADKEATAGERPAAKTVGSFVGERSPTKGPGSAASRGTQKADDDKAQRKMMEDLELLEVGHLKLKPVFPAVVQGHLFMRKYGLSREQRSLVVRATGGSSKFEDVERIIRASDFEDRRPESSRDGRPAPRQPRREGIFAASTDSPSMSEPSLRSSGEEAMEADLETEDEDAQEEIMAAYEAQKKAKEGVKRHFKNYRDQRRKVREIRKNRQPYMPVVALAPDGQGTSAAAVAAGQPQMQPTFRYDRKGKPDGRKRDGTKPKREDVHLLQGQILTEFAYVVASEQTASESEVEILLASIPEGHAILDTGCTSSVVGERTADRLAKFLTSRGVQGPESLDLPPVQLRGFNGARTTSSKGLRWTICLGKLWGTVTTYLIPGEAPFLLSRKVLEGMEATLDLGAMTLTSEKHGMIRQPLAQAANGHMLLPLVPEVVPGHFQVAADQPEVLANSEEPAPGPIPAADADPEVLTANEAPNRLASRCPDKSLEERPPGKRRQPFDCGDTCIFAFRERPIVEDELAFKQLARQYHTGVLPDELEVPSRYMGPGGHYVDLTNAPPEPVDFDELCPSPEHEPPDLPDNPAPAVRRRITHGPEYWAHRAADSAEAQNQLGQLPSPRPEPVTRSLPELPQEGDRAKSRRLDEPSSLAGPPVADSIPIPDTDIESALEYSPSLPPDQEGDPSQEGDMNQSELADVEMPPAEAMCCEVSFDVTKDDIEDDVSCLWTALEECAEVKSKPAKKRRVEVAFRRLSPQDQERFRQAMSKEWQSWLENKVTSIVKAKGIDRSRIIGSRWVLTWKTSADPDNREVVPKARLVLVGYQDPDLGKIATDSPTLRKESKHIILSLCAAFGWTLWSADIKTAFLSGDASCRNIHFRPPPEIRELMGLSSDDLFRLEKAAYGLAEAPRAWFLRLSRELKGIGLTVSALDPCVFVLRNQENGLVGVCGVHVDDLIGGGGPEMDTCLAALRKKLPFGEFRTKTIKYTGAEIRQHEDFSIELSQEAYIEKMDFVQVPGKSTADLEDPGVMRACCGQLAWVASHSRPDQAFLSSYLQGVQDKAQCRHLTMYNKALREMKTQKVTLRFPRVPASDWRLLVITDAGWGVRESGESQGGLILCLCESKVLRQEEGICWVIEWASKKLRRVVRSSTAAETLAAQNGLDCIEFAQAFIQECLNGMSPREFRTWTPEETSGLVIDSKSLYDALTRSACSTALAIEKRLAIDSAIARASLQERNIVPFWTNNLQMVADPLTKLRGATDALYKLLATCRYRIRPESVVRLSAVTGA
ncbi:RE1, partial [Symbiodinium sp. KB8]